MSRDDLSRTRFRQQLTTSIIAAILSLAALSSLLALWEIKTASLLTSNGITLNNLITSVIVGNLIIALTVSIALFYRLQGLAQCITQRLQSLGDLMKRAAAGESSLKATVEGPQDTHELCQAFNMFMEAFEKRSPPNASHHLSHIKVQFSTTVDHDNSDDALLMRFPKRRILVVTHDFAHQLAAASMLTLSGCEYVIAASNKEAIEAISENVFDLILMACEGTEIDGYKTTNHIRLLEKPLGRRTPILAMIVNPQPDDAEKCYAAEMDDYLSQPILLVDLQRKLKNWLTKTLSDPIVEHSATQTGAKFPLDHSTFNKLREILGPTLQQVVTPFLEDTPKYLACLEQAIQSEDAKEVQMAAHAIKGSSSNLGATHLAVLAKEIEELALNNRIDKIRPLLTHAHQAFEAVQAVLGNEHYLNSRVEGTGETAIAHALIVDDDRSTRTTLRYTLERDGFRVEEAENGEQALSRLERFSPDIILMDAIMPVMDGFIACSRIQKLPLNHSIPVLMITALEDNLSAERAFAAGACDYISKPIHFATLSQRVRRIIEANKAERHIHHLAHNDSLTGLPNRTAFIEQLKRHTMHTEHNPNTHLALLFLNLDRFKNINDSLGHHIGDRLLAAVSQRIRNSIRGTDYMARLGGDEFAILLANLTDASTASTAAQHICASLAKPFRIDTHDIFVTARLGIALYPDDTTEAGLLLKYADTAMHQSRKGNTTFRFFKAEMEHAISERMRLEHDLREALALNQLEVFYQPQIQLDSGQIIGTEALVRWRHATRGFVSPMDFIPLAEETGLIAPLGEWVMQAACKQLKVWVDAGMPPLRMAVNISVQQLLNKDFAKIVERIVTETGIPPELLELEITESTLMENAQDTLEVLHQLRQLGVRMSIDDFGTGYSSLAYLKRFPVDIIKIDRSFVKDVPGEADANAIATGIIVLAHSLRLKVVAEGVETEPQLRFLQDQNCDIMQGYYISKPVPAEQLSEEFFTKSHFNNNESSFQ